ncbi:MAG: hypothetical protein AAGJ79_05170 [Verrucomicrobiota bacterium]
MSFLTAKERLLIAGIVSLFVFGGAVKFFRGQNAIAPTDNVPQEEQSPQHE